MGASPTVRLTRKSRRSFIVALTVAAAAPLLASCGIGGSSGADSPASAQENQQQWTMPLDEFAVASVELGNYAEQLLIGDCLAGKGYEWDVPWQNTDFPWPANFNKIGIKLFDVETAQKWGYGLAPPADQDSADRWAKFAQSVDSYNSDTTFQGVFMSCLQEVRDPDTMRDADQFDYIMGLKTQASDVIRTDPNVRQAVKEWKQCVADQYSFDVPDRPEEMPTALVEQLGLPSSSNAVATAKEIEIAVADAKCQESSGYAAATYRAQWDAETELVSENRDKLERIRTEALAHREELLTVIAANAPRP